MAYHCRCRLCWRLLFHYCLSLSRALLLLSVFFYYRMCAQSLNTITPTNKRVMWEREKKKSGQENKQRYYSIYCHYFSPIYLHLKRGRREREREKGSSKKRNHRRAYSMSCIQTIKFIYISVVLSLSPPFILLRHVHWSSWQETDTGGEHMNERSL